MPTRTSPAWLSSVPDIPVIGGKTKSKEKTFPKETLAYFDKSGTRRDVSMWSRLRFTHKKVIGIKGFPPKPVISYRIQVTGWAWVTSDVDGSAFTAKKIAVKVCRPRQCSAQKLRNNVNEVAHKFGAKLGRLPAYVVIKRKFVFEELNGDISPPTADKKLKI